MDVFGVVESERSGLRRAKGGGDMLGEERSDEFIGFIFVAWRGA